MVHTISTDIIIHAPADRVWQALTIPAQVKEYFFGTELEADWQIGGKIFFRGEWEGREYEDKGVITKLEENTRLEYDYFSSWEDIADIPENYLPVSYTLQSIESGTQIIVTQTLRNEEKALHAHASWKKILEDLKQYIETHLVSLTVEVRIKAPIDTVWRAFTSPDHITQWAFASDDWEAPYAENNLVIGGKFLTRMAAKDGSAAFDLIGIYDDIILNEHIAYTLEDGRTVSVDFEYNSSEVVVKEVFQAENMNSLALQKEGWQAILENFCKHVESL